MATMNYHDMVRNQLINKSNEIHTKTMSSELDNETRKSQTRKMV